MRGWLAHRVLTAPEFAASLPGFERAEEWALGWDYEHHPWEWEAKVES